MWVQGAKRNNVKLKLVGSIPLLYTVEPTRYVFHAGKTIVNGETLGITADFARQVIFLAKHLDCSERYVVGILHSVVTANPNLEPVGYIEAAIVEFHRRRRHLVDCLRFILENGVIGPNATPLNRRLHDFVRKDLFVHGGKDPSFAARVFQEVENLGKVIATAQRDKQNAVSNTTAPSSQGLSLHFTFFLRSEGVDFQVEPRRWVMTS
jgi:nuclear pore complex protein Nup205